MAKSVKKCEKVHYGKSRISLPLGFLREIMFGNKWQNELKSGKKW